MLSVTTSYALAETLCDYSHGIKSSKVVVRPQRSGMLPIQLLPSFRKAICYTLFYCLRKLRTFNIHITLFQLFFTSFVSSALTFETVCKKRGGGGGALKKKDRRWFLKNLKRDKEHEDIDTLHRIISKMKKKLNEKTHPMYRIHDQ